jgi:molybdopterin-guanine dinucleotide biosynthesis protein A
VSLPLIEHLLRASPTAEVVIPRWRGELEPLQAVYRRSCLAPVERALAEGRRRMIDFHADVRVHVVEEDVIAGLDPQGLSFFNINTPTDLHAAERLLAATRRNHAA